MLKKFFLIVICALLEHSCFSAYAGKFILGKVAPFAAAAAKGTTAFPTLLQNKEKPKPTLSYVPPSVPTITEPLPLPATKQSALHALFTQAAANPTHHNFLDSTASFIGFSPFPIQRTTPRVHDLSEVQSLMNPSEKEPEIEEIDIRPQPATPTALQNSSELVPVQRNAEEHLIITLTKEQQHFLRQLLLSAVTTTSAGSLTLLAKKPLSLSFAQPLRHFLQKITPQQTHLAIVEPATQALVPFTAQRSTVAILEAPKAQPRTSRSFLTMIKQSWNRYIERMPACQEEIPARPLLATYQTLQHAPALPATPAQPKNFVKGMIISQAIPLALPVPLQPIEEAPTEEHHEQETPVPSPAPTREPSPIQVPEDVDDLISEHDDRDEQQTPIHSPAPTRESSPTPEPEEQQIPEFAAPLTEEDEPVAIATEENEPHELEAQQIPEIAAPLIEEEQEEDPRPLALVQPAPPPHIAPQPLPVPAALGRIPQPAAQPIHPQAAQPIEEEPELQPAAAPAQENYPWFFPLGYLSSLFSATPMPAETHQQKEASQPHPPAENPTTATMTQETAAQEAPSESAAKKPTKKISVKVKMPHYLPSEKAKPSTSTIGKYIVENLTPLWEQYIGHIPHPPKAAEPTPTEQEPLLPTPEPEDEEEPHTPAPESEEASEERVLEEPLFMPEVTASQNPPLYPQPQQSPITTQQSVPTPQPIITPQQSAPTQISTQGPQQVVQPQQKDNKKIVETAQKTSSFKKKAAATTGSPLSYLPPKKHKKDEKTTVTAQKEPDLGTTNNSLSSSTTNIPAPALPNTQPDTTSAARTQEALYPFEQRLWKNVYRGPVIVGGTGTVASPKPAESLAESNTCSAEKANRTHVIVRYGI